MPRSSKKTIRPKPIVLLVLEGWGVATAHPGNAITEAAPDYFNYLLSHYPAVTLTPAEPATAETGHAMIGLGRKPFNAVGMIGEKIAQGVFKDLPVLKQAIAQAKKNRLHIISLLSTSEGEASFAHLEALIAAVAARSVTPYLHVILDGRDTVPTAGKDLLARLEKILEPIGGKIASCMGRLYGLDQTHHEERTEKALGALRGTEATASDLSAAVAGYYAAKIFDEEAPPTVVVDEIGQPVGPIRPEDTIIFANTVGAPLHQLIDQLAVSGITNLFSLVEYGFPGVRAIIAPAGISRTLGSVVAAANLKQLRISDSEGFADVTCFLNNGNCQPASGEDRLLIPTAVTETEGERGEKAIEALAKTVIRSIEERNHDVIIATFSALDRIAHTADVVGAVAIVRALDIALKRIVTAVLEAGGISLVTSSHGVAETTMLPATMNFSSHTGHPVPFLLVGKQFAGYSLRFPQPVGGDLSLLAPVGSLADVAPTLLRLAHLDIPADMTGRSLIDDAS